MPSTRAPRRASSYMAALPTPPVPSTIASYVCMRHQDTRVPSRVRTRIDDWKFYDFAPRTSKSIEAWPNLSPRRSFMTRSRRYLPGASFFGIAMPY